MTSRLWLFKFFSMLIIGLVFLSTPVFSQIMRDSSRNFMNIDHLRTRLSLSDEQTAKLQGILDSFRKQTQTDREKYQSDRPVMMKAAQERILKLDKEMEALLTPEQLKKYEQMKQEQRERMRERFRDRMQQQQQKQQ